MLFAIHGEPRYDAGFRSLLDSGTASTDILRGIVRLLSKSYSPQNGEAILKVLEKNGNGENWEPAAVAASSLAAYGFEDVIQALIRALHSRIWYSCVNSAKFLAAMKASDAYLSHKNISKKWVSPRRVQIKAE